MLFISIKRVTGHDVWGRERPKLQGGRLVPEERVIICSYFIAKVVGKQGGSDKSPSFSRLFLRFSASLYQHKHTSLGKQLFLPFPPTFTFLPPPQTFDVISFFLSHLLIHIVYSLSSAAAVEPEKLTSFYLRHLKARCVFSISPPVIILWWTAGTTLRPPIICPPKIIGLPVISLNADTCMLITHIFLWFISFTHSVSYLHVTVEAGFLTLRATTHSYSGQTDSVMKRRVGNVERMVLTLRVV